MERRVFQGLTDCLAFLDAEVREINCYPSRNKHAFACMLTHMRAHTYIQTHTHTHTHTHTPDKELMIHWWGNNPLLQLLTYLVVCLNLVKITHPVSGDPGDAGSRGRPGYAPSWSGPRGFPGLPGPDGETGDLGKDGELGLDGLKGQWSRPI